MIMDHKYSKENGNEIGNENDQEGRVRGHFG